MNRSSLLLVIGLLVLVSGGAAVVFLNNTPPAPTTYTVAVVVADSSNSAPLSSTTVTLNGVAKTTDASGATSFTIASGTYALDISKNGYVSKSESVVVSGDVNLSRNLSPNPPPTYTVTVMMTDSSNASPLAGVSVTLGGVLKLTDSGGAATFTVASGTYTLAASKTGYVSKSETVVISGDAGLNRSLTPSPPPTYTVAVTVTNSSNSAPLVGVTVTFNGVPKTTDAAGSASFIVVSGTYTLAISKPGYVSRSESVAVAGDVSLNRSLTLTSPTTPVTVTFDFDTGVPPLSLSMSTPFDQSSGGVTAHFSSPSDPSAFSLQNQATTGFNLPGFTGKYLYQNQVARTYLDITFSQTITNITITFSAVEYHDPFGQPSPIKVTAYLNTTTSTPVGTATANGSVTSGTYPVGALTFDSGGQAFNIVRIELPFLAQGATAYLVDNVVIRTK